MTTTMRVQQAPPPVLPLPMLATAKARALLRVGAARRGKRAQGVLGQVTEVLLLLRTARRQKQRLARLVLVLLAVLQLMLVWLNLVVMPVDVWAARPRKQGGRNRARRSRVLETGARGCSPCLASQNRCVSVCLAGSTVSVRCKCAYLHA